MGALEKALIDKDPELGKAMADNAWKRNIAMAMRQLRFNAGLSQEDLAKKAKLSQSHISKIEAPYGGLPSLETLKKYAKACGKDVMHLEFLSKDEVVNVDAPRSTQGKVVRTETTANEVAAEPGEAWLT